MIVQQGKNIHLRPITLDDANENYQRWLNDSEINQYLESRFSVQTLEGLKNFVRSMLQSKTDCFFAICHNENGSHIGNIKIGSIDSYHQRADIGLLIGEKSCWGRGFATEAIALATKHAFDILKLKKLSAGCYAANEASARSFEKCGYSREGLLREHVVCGNRRMDVILLGLTLAEYSTKVSSS